MIQKIMGCISLILLSGNNSSNVVHTHVPLSPSSINYFFWKAAVPCGLEVTSFIFALIVCHKLKPCYLLIILELTGLVSEMSTTPVSQEVCLALPRL